MMHDITVISLYVNDSREKPTYYDHLILIIESILSFFHATYKTKNCGEKSPGLLSLISKCCTKQLKTFKLNILHKYPTNISTY